MHMYHRHSLSCICKKGILNSTSGIIIIIRHDFVMAIYWLGPGFYIKSVLYWCSHNILCCSCFDNIVTYILKHHNKGFMICYYVDLYGKAVVKDFLQIIQYSACLSFCVAVCLLCTGYALSGECYRPYHCLVRDFVLLAVHTISCL